MKTKLDRLESRLNAAGIATRRNYIRAENGSAPVLIADHDYTGPYPTRETWGQISTVDRVAARYKGLRLERRGYYQATFIWEEVAPLDYPVYLASPDHDYLGDREKILTAQNGRDTINTMEARQSRGKGQSTMKAFEINGTEYTVEPCTAICAADAGDESKRQEALYVANKYNGELFEYIVFGYDMPETEEAFLEMCDDASAWESDWETLKTALYSQKKGQTTMKQISVDNGTSYTTPAAALEEISLDTMAEYMDDDTREAVHNEIAPCTDLEFLERYLEIAPDDLIIG